MKPGRFEKRLPRQRLRQWGQGLLEFALILPLLLLVLMGIADFGRGLLIYTDLFNAAREGTRRGAVDPWDVSEIQDSVHGKMSLLNPSDITLSICCDSGPGTGSFYCNQDDGVPWTCGDGTGSWSDGRAGIGDRVVVSATHNLRPLTPPVLAIVSELGIRTQSARTIVTVGESFTPPAGEGGTDDDEESASIALSVAAQPQTVTSGESVTFTYTVTNTGEVDLRDVFIVDDFDNTIVIGDLSAGAAATRTTVEIVNTTTTNDVTATGTDPESATVSDSDSVTVTVVGPALDLGVRVSPQTVYKGDVVTFTYTVTNTGDTDLTNVTVADSFGTSLDPVINLAMGSPPVFWEVTRTLLETVTNDVTATGTYSATQVNDSESATAYVVLHPIIIHEPLNAGSTVVSGTAEPGETVRIRDLMDGDFPTDSITVLDDGTFEFIGLPELVPQHVIVVEGYDEWDSELVLGDFDPIEISTPLCHGSNLVTGTAEPGYALTLLIPTASYEDYARVDRNGYFTFTLPVGQPLQFDQSVSVSAYGETDLTQVAACTTDAFIAITPPCGGPGSDVSVNVKGYNWDGTTWVDICWDDQCDYSRRTDSDGFFDYDIILPPVTEGTHTIMADARGSSPDIDTATFVSPCPRPNVVVSGLSLLTTEPISTYQPISFRMTVANTGTKPINNLFWVDLYSVEPGGPQSGNAWAAVSALGSGASIPLTVTIQNGLPTTGTHEVWAYGDSWDDVWETNEYDNAAGPETVNITQEGEPPSPPSGNGAIVGETWVSLSGVPVPHERVRVWCENTDTGDRYGPVYSEEDATYELDGLPDGTYTVMAQTWIDSARYFGSVSDVILSGSETEVVIVILYKD